jgi:LPS-assembly lipoprotein
VVGPWVGAVGRFIQLIPIFLLAASTGGCFQPLYGKYSLGGGDSSNIAQSLGAVDVLQIDPPNTDDARLAVEVRNDLLFALQGGDGGTSPTHSLKVKLVAQLPYTTSVDIQTGRSETSIYNLTAAYQLTDLRTGKVVLTATAVAPVSFDNPGEQQRFANARALRDAQNRAGQQVADSIRSRLASFFVSGT